MGGAFTVVCVVNYKRPIEPNSDSSALTAYTNRVPMVRIYPCIIGQRDRAPAVGPHNPPFQRTPRVSPSTEIGPIELLIIQNAQQDEEPLRAANFSRFQRELIVGSMVFSKNKPPVDPRPFLNKRVLLAAPRNTCAVTLETPIPNQLPP